MPEKSPLIKFTPARLATGKEWFVEYYVLNPTTEKLARKRIKLNRIKSLTERRKYAKHIINELNEKLYRGWNPFLEENAPKGFTKLVDALDIFYRHKSRELRKDSLRSYRSMINRLKEWLKVNNKLDMYCSSYTRAHAYDLMDHIDSLGVKNVTWNNNRRLMEVLFNWLLSRDYVAENPFKSIKKKKVEQKKRVIIDVATRQKVKNYLEKNDYNFLIVNMLLFHAFLRPKEISQLKPKDFHLKKKGILIPAAVSKNGKEEMITIPNALMDYLSSWNFNNAKRDEYIFGTDLLPGKTSVGSRRFSKKWSDLRKVLDIPMEMQLYSMKDTGIVQMLADGIPPHDVMHQARHADLEVTTAYVKLANPAISEKIILKNSGF